MSDIYWRGGAAPVSQVTTLTFGSTWAALDTYSFKIGAKQLLLTIGTDATVATIATQFFKAFNASAASDGDLGAAYIRSSGGQQIPEFLGIVATNPSAGVVVLTGLPGVPFTFTSLATTVGTGDTTTVTGLAATGPNHMDNAANWLGGVLPSTGDRMVFDQGQVDALYGLTYFRTNSIEHDMRIFGNWRGQLGLAAVNPAGYPEYRDRFYRWQTGPNVLEILPSTDGYTDQKPVFIDLQGCPGSTVRVLAGRGDVTSPNVNFIGGDASTGLVSFQVEKGNVYVEPPESTATNKFFADSISIGIPGGTAGDCTVFFGRSARTEEATTFVQYSGRAYSAAVMINGADECPIDIRGGEFHSEMRNYGSSPALQDVTIRPGATLFLSGEGTIENIDNGGTLDLRNGNGSFAIVGYLTLNRGCSVYDPGGRGVKKLKFAPTCSIQDCTIQTGPGLNWAA